MVGGALIDTYGSFRYNVVRNAERQTLRAAVSYWFTPKLQSALELDHDVQAEGGYKTGVEALGRIKYLF
jgi:hypothetical protein